MNTIGGTMYIGVKNDGTITGMDMSPYTDDIIKERIGGWVVSFLEPTPIPSEYEITCVPVVTEDGTQCAVVGVTFVSAPVRYVRKDSAYGRTDASTRKLSDGQVAELQARLSRAGIYIPPLPGERRSHRQRSNESLEAEEGKYRVCFLCFVNITYNLPKKKK
eukprot:TRINITY_DN800_c0_g1_i1.p1 TRINITY_DN800_c0_g1~~TRINITY_DN800_c0_g1_i1.p1  ORF type:complete len:162 (-),score=11.41 TRINITY_DN800_c0_g1_i1:54-539(-)